MSNDPVGRRPRSAGLHSTLRAAAVAAVALGVVLLAAAAFVLSYQGIHHIALRAGVSPELAKLYPLIFDVMLVVAGAAALALRGASLWARCYAWGSLLILLAAMAVGNAVYALGTTLPAKPTKVAVAVIPWVLLLMAFGLLLEILRHFRSTRSRAAVATAGATAAGAAAAGTMLGADINGRPQTPGTEAAASGGTAPELPRVDLDTLLGPRDGEPPAIAILHGIGTGQNDRHQVDPVSYGEETGYVHPDSYLNEGEYSPHGDTGGPGSPDGLTDDNAGDGTHLTRHGTAPAEAPATAAAHPATPAADPAGHVAAPANSAEPATSAEPLFTPAAAPATSTERAATPAAATVTDTEPLFTPAAPPATAPEPAATSAAAPATSTEPAAAPAAATVTDTEPLFTPAAPPTTAAEPAATSAATPATSTEPEAAPEAAVTDTGPLSTPEETPATPAETPVTPAETSATSAETPATPAETSATSAETPATSAETPATAAEPPTTPTETPATAAETPTTSPVATAAPVEAQAASGTGNGLAAGGGPAGAEASAGQEGAAEADQADGADVKQEAVGAEGPPLERIRSTPSRPEE